MWIFTTAGFVSAVEDTDDPSKVVVRSRDRASLQAIYDGIETLTGNLDEDDEILVGLGTDYPYRLYVGREDFAQYMAHEVREYLNYGNFKNEARASLGAHWADLLADVWAVMLGATDDEGRSVR